MYTRHSHCLRSLPLCLAVAIVMCTWGAAFTSCSDDNHSYVKNMSDALSTPTMSTTNVSTSISDSGYTRYHITTPTWLMFEEAPDPFWKFPHGIDLQQFDLNRRVSATMTCDSATYLSQKRVWRLDGNVIMVNTMRDSFLTQQVFWDQNRRQVYSDSFIHIVRSNRIIEGYGFTSNENITRYSVNNPTAIIPIDRRPGSSETLAPATADMPDSLQDEAPTPRHATYQRRSTPTQESLDADEYHPEKAPAAGSSSSTRQPRSSKVNSAKPATAKPRPTIR